MTAALPARVLEQTPAPMAPPAVEAHGLCKTYDGHAVVRHVDLSIPGGCVYGLLGRNGAGKSTLTRMLTGMIHPDAGTARLLGEDIRSIAPKTRGRVAYTAEGHPLYAGLTVRQSVRLMKGLSRRWDGDLVGRILDHFELPDGRKVRRLSKGQRAQLSLALAVGPDPDLFIMDDPTLGLDPVVRRDFLESMVQIIQRPGRTVVFSSHVLGDVERVADRIGVMVDGVLRVDCPTDLFKASARKLVLRFEGPPPSYPPAGSESPAGLVYAHRRGRELDLFVVGAAAEHRAMAERLNPASLEVLELNLEDAFLEYARGRRKPLPVFASGPTLPATGVGEAIESGTAEEDER